MPEELLATIPPIMQLSMLEGSGPIYKEDEARHQLVGRPFMKTLVDLEMQAAKYSPQDPV